MRKFKTMLLSAGIAAVLALGGAVGAHLATNDAPMRTEAAATPNVKEKTYTHAFATGELGTESGDVVLDGITWTKTAINSYIGFDNSKGIQLGSSGGKLNPTPFQLTTKATNFGSKINSILINASTASKGQGSISYTLNSIESEKYSLTKTAEVYTFAVGKVPSGDLTLNLYSEKDSKAVYLNSISVVYETIATEVNSAKTIWNAGKGTYYNGGTANHTFSTKDITVTSLDANGKTIDTYAQGTGFVATIKVNDVVKYTLDATTTVQTQDLAGIKTTDKVEIIASVKKLDGVTSVNAPALKITLSEVEPIIEIIKTGSHVVGDTFAIETTVLDGDASKLKYEVADPAIVRANDDGTFTALKDGKTDITGYIMVGDKKVSSKAKSVSIHPYNLMSAYSAYKQEVSKVHNDCTIIVKVPETIDKDGSFNIELANGKKLFAYSPKTPMYGMYNGLTDAEKYSGGDLIRLTGNTKTYTPKNGPTKIELDHPYFTKVLTDFEKFIYEFENNKVCGLTTTEYNAIKAKHDAMTTEQKALFDNYTVLNVEKQGSQTYAPVTFAQRYTAMGANLAGSAGIQTIYDSNNNIALIIILSISVLAISGIAIFAITRRKKLAK